MALIQAEGVLCRTGKTQEALHYARTVRRYDKIFWLKATDEENLNQSLQAIREEIPFFSRDYLENTPGYLIVFDNARDMQLISPHIPSAGKQLGHILVTSRERNWPGFEPIEVGVFTKEEALHCFQKLTQNYDEIDSAVELVKSVEYVPALVHKLGEEVGHSIKLETYSVLQQQKGMIVQRQASLKSNLPPPSPFLKNYLGRASEVDWLDHALENWNKSVFIQGPEGFGKTFMALHYAYSQLLSYNFIGYVSCTSPKLMEACYCQMAEKLGIKKKMEGEELFHQVTAELCKKSNFLLILEDVKEYESIQHILLKKNGHFILTGTSSLDNHIPCLTLSSLTPKHLLQLLIKTSRKEKENLKHYKTLLRSDPLFVTFIGTLLREGLEIRPDELKGEKDPFSNLIANWGSMEPFFSLLNKKQKARKGLENYPYAIPLFKKICLNDSNLVLLSDLHGFLEKEWGIPSEEVKHVAILLLNILKDLFPIEIFGEVFYLHPRLTIIMKQILSS